MWPVLQQEVRVAIRQVGHVHHHTELSSSRQWSWAGMVYDVVHNPGLVQGIALLYDHIDPASTWIVDRHLWTRVNAHDCDAHRQVDIIRLPDAKALWSLR